LVLCYCKIQIWNFLYLFIQGFELLVFRYTNISCKIRSTSSNKNGLCTNVLLDEVQASNSIKWGQREPAPPWMDGVWTVHGQDTFFSLGSCSPPANLPMAAWF
jgi:hypothetical protein